MKGAYGDEPITYRQHLIEETLILGLDSEPPVDSFGAIEAVSSMLLDHPEIDADEIRPRRVWEGE